MAINVDVRNGVWIEDGVVVEKAVAGVIELGWVIIGEPPGGWARGIAALASVATGAWARFVSLNVEAVEAVE